MKLRDETPSFDFETDPPSESQGTDAEATTASAGGLEVESEWQEVPQALFLSWSPQMQAAYCAARDEDAALCGWEPTSFYLERAEGYRGLRKS